MKKQITIILSILMATLLIASCGKDPSIVGKWEYSRESTQEGNKMALKVYFDFKDDGTGNYEMFVTNPQYPDKKVQQKSAPLTWSLSEDGKMLTMVVEGTDTVVGTVAELTDETLVLETEKFQDLTEDSKMPLNRIK